MSASLYSLGSVGSKEETEKTGYHLQQPLVDNKKTDVFDKKTDVNNFMDRQKKIITDIEDKIKKITLREDINKSFEKIMRDKAAEELTDDEKAALANGPAGGRKKRTRKSRRKSRRNKKNNKNKKKTNKRRR